MKGSVGLDDADYEKISNKLNRKAFYFLEDVKDRIEKVAFDVVRFKDSEGLDKLWVVQNQDGRDVIVATYDEEDGLEVKASWEAVASRNGSDVNVYYKGEPVKKFASASLGIPVEEAHVVCRYLPKKLADDSEFRQKFLKGLSAKEREDLVNRFPELKG